MTVLARAAIYAAAVVVSADLAGAAGITTVALTGDTAPGTGGALFQGFGTPTINAAGHVTTDADLQVDVGGVTFETRQGYWTGTKDDLVLLGREGSPLSGHPAISFTDFGVSVAGGVGNAVTKASTTGGRGLIGGPAGDVRPIALPGMQAPGYAEGVTFGNQIMGLLANTTPRANALGQTAFTANTIGNPPPGSNGGMWHGTAGNLTLVVRHAAQAPALPAGVNIQNFSDPVLNNLGAVGFSAAINGAGVDATNNGVVYIGQPGALQVLARAGDVVPGTGGLTFAGNPFPGSIFGMPSINNAGQAAFGATLGGTGVTSANDGVLVVATAAGPVVVAREGDPIAGAPAGVTHWLMGAPHLGGGGHVVFDGRIAGAGVTTANDAALFAGLPGAIRMLAREGDVAPGATDGAHFWEFDPATINHDGQVALVAYLQGPGVDFANNTALFAADAGGDLFMVARTGTPLDLGNGDLRMVDSLHYWGYSGGQDGLGSGLSDNGQLVFAADFADGTSGVFVTRVPEPSSLALAGLAIAARRHRRRRRRR